MIWKSLCRPSTEFKKWERLGKKTIKGTGVNLLINSEATPIFIQQKIVEELKLPIT